MNFVCNMLLWAALYFILFIICRCRARRVPTDHCVQCLSRRSSGESTSRPRSSSCILRTFGLNPHASSFYKRSVPGGGENAKSDLRIWTDPVARMFGLSFGGYSCHHAWLLLKFYHDVLVLAGRSLTLLNLARVSAVFNTRQCRDIEFFKDWMLQIWNGIAIAHNWGCCLPVARTAYTTHCRQTFYCWLSANQSAMDSITHLFYIPEQKQMVAS